MTELVGTGAVTTQSNHVAAAPINNPLLTTHFKITVPANWNPRSLASFGINLSSRHHCDAFVLFSYTRQLDLSGGVGGLSACRETWGPLTALTNQGEAVQRLTVLSIPSILR